MDTEKEQPHTLAKTKRNPRVRWILGVVALVVCGVMYWSRQQRSESVDPHVTEPITLVAPVQPQVVMLPEETLADSVPTGEGRSAVVVPDSCAVEARLQGTHNMVLAHISLRASEVADPDSPTNRQVLQNLVAMAKAKRTGGEEE